MNLTALLLSITVTWAPLNYPTFTTNNVDTEGRHFRSITMYVNTEDRSSAIFRLNEDDTRVWRPEETAGLHVLRYPAGVGRHTVEVWLKFEDGTSEYVVRTFSVYRAPKKERRNR